MINIRLNTSDCNSPLFHLIQVVRVILFTLTFYFFIFEGELLLQHQITIKLNTRLTITLISSYSGCKGVLFTLTFYFFIFKGELLLQHQITMRCTPFGRV